MDGELLMTAALFFLVWLVCAVVSYFLHRAWWLRDHDFYTDDRRDFIWLSLVSGPISLALLLFELFRRRPRGSPRLLRARKGRP
jgi:hypothetical protein